LKMTKSIYAVTPQRSDWESTIQGALLSDKHFSQLSGFIYDICGIKLPPAKKTMLEARLSKRLRALGIGSYDSYCDLLMSDGGLHQELVHMIDVVTTNKTEFFRESAHFDYLTQRLLPLLTGRSCHTGRQSISIWSAGCSTGEEPYTLAMVLAEAAAAYPGLEFSILATDISVRVLEYAQRAIYERDKIAAVPKHLQKKYFLRGRNGQEGKYRIVPELRERVSFRRLNFMEDDFGMRDPVDVIFCRNVIIYFDKPTQERLLRKFYDHLGDDGYLFLGHSETIHGMRLPLVSAAPTVYRKVS